MRGGLILLFFVCSVLTAQHIEPERTQADFRKDFETLWAEINTTYAYFDQKATRWADVPRSYKKDLERVHTQRQFVQLLEKVLEELYDHHVQLTVNTSASPRLVPSDTDLWANWIGDRAIVTEVRPDSNAAKAGIKPAAVVQRINGIPIAEAVDRRIGRTVPSDDAAVRDWALRAVLAGFHNQARHLEILQNGTTFLVELPAADQFRTRQGARVVFDRRGGRIGYIRFNDSLGDLATIGDFDAALASLRNTDGLILDLRDTASGGNSTVARAIMGRFVDRELPYQKHVLAAEEREVGIRRSWIELVSPRGPFTYTEKVVVLVNHWTGSMGEGVAIGFDALDRATIVGTPMAGLLGATYHITLPRTNIGVNVPAEKLFHIDGTPRESFHPTEEVDLRGSSLSGDVILERGLDVLHRAMSKTVSN